MKEYPTEKIRNIAFAGHSDTGKTTLVSLLLFNAGATTRAGSIDDGTTVTDFDEDEIQMKHSVSAATAWAEHEDTKLNLLDTPGYGVFLNEARCAIRVADTVAITVSAVNGPEINTERVWKIANSMETPVAFVATKMDRDRANAESLIAALQEKFGKSVVAAQMPIGAERDFRGVVDLVEMQAWVYETDGSGNYEKVPIPDDLRDQANAWRETLVEKIAESDDSLMERFFEEGTLTQQEIEDGIRREMIARSINPLFFVSPSANIGGHALLEAFVRTFPSPDQLPVRMVREGSLDDKPVALIFKTISDPFSGRISVFRVYSGTLSSDTPYFNSTRDHDERFGKLQIVQGKQQEPVGSLHAGDIGAVAKLKDSHTGDTITGKGAGVILDFVDIPESTISFAIEPKSKGDEDKLSTAISRIIEEDPSIRFRRDEQTHEFLLSGQGQLHVETAVNRLRNRYGVDVILHPPKVPYLETVRAKVNAHGRHKKQSGGHGQFADCKITLEPLPRGSDFEFVDEIFGGSIPRQYIPAVEKGIQEVRTQGYLAGFPVVDFRVRLTDGQFHAVDSSELAFKIAGAMAFKDAMSRAKPTLLEPIMHIEVTSPSEYIGDLMGDLTSRRGRMEGMETEGETQIIRAHIPMAEVLTYGSTLRSITQGRGSFHIEFSHYEEVPKNLQQKIIAEAQAPAHSE
ncbi:MAG: elongation factor G [Acidobacteria bacterium]|nr:elongation factor G [Acidobacteriota bacterium]